MRVSFLGGLLAATTVNAFSDSSPFLLFSTSKFAVSHDSATIATASKTLATAKNILAQCPTDNYLLVSQPDVNARDLYHKPAGGVQAHRLHRAYEGAGVQGRFQVTEVVKGGDKTSAISMDDLTSYIHEVCGDKEIVLQSTELPALEGDRAEAVGDNDYQLVTLLDNLSDDYTVIYFSENKPTVSTPARVVRRAESPSGGFEFPKNAPLFEKYAFFSPGMFMGLVAVSIMFSILFVGLKSVASLEVSYGAFDKEMGPSNQKKQQ